MRFLMIEKPAAYLCEEHCPKMRHVYLTYYTRAIKRNVCHVFNYRYTDKTKHSSLLSTSSDKNKTEKKFLISKLKNIY